MAKARKVVGDQNSEEMDQLRRAVHGILVLLENVGTALGAATADATVTDIGDGLAAAINTGTDADSASYTGSGVDVAGMEPTPKHPKRPTASGKLVDVDPKNL